MDVILNIGLNVASGNNAYDARSERGEVALRYLSGFFPKIINKRLLTTYDDANGTPTIEDTLVVHLLDGLNAEGSVYSAIFNLAQLLDQDCIAVFFTSVQEGLLIGPRANEWGAFDPQYFRVIEELSEKPARNAGVSQAA